MTDLKDALKTLHALTYDELTDLIDLLRNVHDETRPPRHGKPPLEDIIAGGWYPDPDGDPDRKTPPARPELRNAWNIAVDLAQDDAHALIEQASLVRDALAPRTKRQRNAAGETVARGTLQTKIIRRNVIETDKDGGNPRAVRKAFGPYLYLRMWATGGGKNRDQRRLKNVYLGCKRLADDLNILDGDEHAALVDDILTAYESGGVEAVRDLDGGKRPAEQKLLGDADILPNKRSAETERSFRPTVVQLKLLKKAVNATPDKPRYVTRDTPSYNALIELLDAGLVEIFTRGNSTRRRYYLLTDAGREAAQRRFDQL